MHVLPLSDDRALVVHAITHLRLGIDSEVERLIAWFDAPRVLPDELPSLRSSVAYDDPTLGGCVASLIERGVLTEMTADEELASTTAELRQTHGREPGDMIERYRREHQEGTNPYWAVSASLGVSDLNQKQKRLDLLLLGDCELQMEADFLRREGARRGLDLRIAASFPDDVRLADERQHQAIFVGALRSRHSITLGAADDEQPPFEAYIEEARHLIEALRMHSSAPIFIDNLPEPTVQPLGFADRGLNSHRNRFRRANLALEQLTEHFKDVYLVDIAATLAAVGSNRFLDDGLTSFTHFGSPGWMLQRPESELSAVHGLFPDTASLAQAVDGDPYGREATVARAHTDALVTVLGIDRKKCMIVDLDGILWPGVLAETGAPFAWHPEISGLYSYAGLFFGIHEALKALKRRGILLAAVSKNDEATIRELWRYPSHYPHERLLTLDDFVTWRINWCDKTENIRSIAAELGLALESFAFIDDHPVERERVRQHIPEIAVWGDDLFSLRRILLNDPRLQQPRVTRESEARTGLVKAQLGRAAARVTAPSEAEFLASLEIVYDVEQVISATSLDRVQELFDRTTQFNTTGRKFSAAELTLAIASGTSMVFTMTVRDRFGDHGLVGACVITKAEIIGFALSCRVIGLGLEHKFLDTILDRLDHDDFGLNQSKIMNVIDSHNLERDAGGKPVPTFPHPALTDTHENIVARIIETPRNIPVRNLYRDHGFSTIGDGLWTRRLHERLRVSA